ncbi:MAG: type II toxin-antitoxin system PemK/MazF family toxin [Bacilli bacterium]|jgi:mRNA interferase MazF
MQKYLRGQIWWCNCVYDVNSSDRDIKLGDNQKVFDHIQKGMRPVLIISNDTGNKFSETVQVVPCTSAEKNSLPTHCSFYIDKIKNTFLCEQIRTVNKSDLKTYLISLDDQELSVVEKCFQIALGIIKPTHFEKITVGIDELGDKNTTINKEETNE